MYGDVLGLEVNAQVFMLLVLVLELLLPEFEESIVLYDFVFVGFRKL